MASQTEYTASGNASLPESMATERETATRPSLGARASEVMKTTTVTAATTKQMVSLAAAPRKTFGKESTNLGVRRTDKAAAPAKLILPVGVKTGVQLSRSSSSSSLSSTTPAHGGTLTLQKGAATVRRTFPQQLMVNLTTRERVQRALGQKLDREIAMEKTHEEADAKAQEKRKKTAEKKQRAEERARLARERKEHKARDARRNEWHDAMVGEMAPILSTIDWQVALRTVRGAVGSLGVSLERMREKPAQHYIVLARLVDAYPVSQLTFLTRYQVWVVEMVRRMERSHWRDEETVRRNRLKLAALRDKGAKVEEAVAEGPWSKDEKYWKLKTLDRLARPLAEDVWRAATEEMVTKRRVRYVDGLPTDLAPTKWTVLPTEWKSKQDMRRKWSPCAQCEAAGVTECSRERWLPKNSEEPPCLRCRRMGEVCIRLDPDWQDQDLGGLPRWSKYVAADKSLDNEEAQLKAEGLLQRRGKRFVNVCGLVIDAVDTNGFGPPAMPTLDPKDGDEDGGEDGGDERLSGALSKIFPRPPPSPEDETRAAAFRARMARIRSDDYWEAKAVAAGKGMADWGGGTRESRRRGPTPVKAGVDFRMPKVEDAGPKQPAVI